MFIQGSITTNINKLHEQLNLCNYLLMAKDYYICPICSRNHTKDNMTWHHLFPKVGNQDKLEPAIYICHTCHTVIHYSYSNKELRDKYNNLNEIISSEDIKSLVNLYKYKADDKIYKIKKLIRKENDRKTKLATSERLQRKN